MTCNFITLLATGIEATGLWKGFLYSLHLWRDSQHSSMHFMSLLNCVPYLFTRERALRAYVPKCQQALRAYVLTWQCAFRASVLTCQRVFCAYVLTCQRVLRAYALTCQHVLRNYLLTSQHVLHAHVLTCLACSQVITSNNENKFSMTCFA